MSDDGAGYTLDVVETSAGVYLVTGRDAAGRSVVRHGEDPEVLKAECLTWLQAQGAAREYVGFVWHEDTSEQTGILVEAPTGDEAIAAIREALGDDIKSSLWNEEDAARPRG